MQIHNFNFVDGPLGENDALGRFDFCDSANVLNYFEESSVEDENVVSSVDQSAFGASVAANEIHLRRRMDSKDMKQLNVVASSSSSHRFKFRRKRRVRVDRKSTDDYSSTSTSSLLSESENQTLKRTPTKSSSKRNINKKINVNSVSNYLNWRLINTCLTYKLSSEKDTKLLEMTLIRNFAQFKCTKFRSVTELKLIMILICVWIALIACGALRWGDDFFTCNSLFATKAGNRSCH